MPVSNRHKHRARKQGRRPVAPREYKILDENHQPDLKGEFGGAKVVRKGDGQYVQLTDAQAHFYLQSGSIELSGAEQGKDDHKRQRQMSEEEKLRDERTRDRNAEAKDEARPAVRPEVGLGGVTSAAPFSNPTPKAVR